MLLPLLPPSVITSKRHTFTFIPLPDVCMALRFYYCARDLFRYTVCSNKPKTQIWKFTSMPRFVFWTVMRLSDVLKMSKHFFFLSHRFVAWAVHSYVSVVSSVHAWGNFSTSCSVIFWVPQRFSLWFYRVKQHHAVLDMLQQICFISCIHPTMD